MHEYPLNRNETNDFRITAVGWPVYVLEDEPQWSKLSKHLRKFLAIIRTHAPVSISIVSLHRFVSLHLVSSVGFTVMQGHSFHGMGIIDMFKLLSNNKSRSQS